MQYYYHDGKDQKGPYSFNELISLGIKPNTKVWREGLQEWQNAGELEEFKNILKTSSPPTFKEKPDMPPVFNNKTEPAEQSGSKKTAALPEKKSNYSGAIIAFAIIGVLATGAFFYSQYNQARGGRTDTYDYAAPAETYEEKKMSLAEQEAAYPINFLSADGTYRETLIGRKFALEIDVSSTATVATYKDIDIKFIYYTRTNTQLSTVTYTFYQYVKPGKATHIETKIPRPDGATQVGWEVVGALVAN